jgi:TPR repeat protein
MARFEMTGAEMAPLAGSVAPAQGFFELGILYATGRDVELDLVSAHKWLNIAAVKGNREAVRYRQELAREMSAAAVAEAQRAAREWLSRH